jgi:hypothetical protein
VLGRDRRRPRHAASTSPYDTIATKNSPARTKPSEAVSLRRRSLCYSARHIAEAVANLLPDQLARFRRWFTAFEAGRADHAGELDSPASELGRFAGRAFAEMKRRANNRE